MDDECVADDGLLRVNLGCSETRMLDDPDGWVNVDIRDDVGADIVADLRTENPFGPMTVKEIFCSHMLEHFDLGRAYKLLGRMSDWLVPGGVLWLAVPDFSSLAVHYIMGEYSEELYDLITGHGTHLSQWTRAHLTRALEYFGFEVVADDFSPMAQSPDSGQLDSSRRVSIRYKCVRGDQRHEWSLPAPILTPLFYDPEHGVDANKAEDVSLMLGWIVEIMKRQTMRRQLTMAQEE